MSFTVPSLFTFFAGSGQYLYWYLSDPVTDLPITTSAITATLYAGRDINNPTMTPGTPVANFNGLTLAAVPTCPGKYQVLIPSTFNPALGTGYVLVVDAVTTGYQNMHWEVLAQVEQGAVQIATCNLLVSPPQFRNYFPEFRDSSKYPDGMISFWMGVASLFLNRDRWCDAICYGAELYVAHMIVLQKQAIDTNRAGGWPGISKGAVNSENPGAVTVSYDTQATLEEGGGHWNLTNYGNQFIRLARIMGTGPIQVGPCAYGPGSLSPIYNINSAWSGPPFSIGSLY